MAFNTDYISDKQYFLMHCLCLVLFFLVFNVNWPIAIAVSRNLLKAVILENRILSMADKRRFNFQICRF